MEGTELVEAYGMFVVLAIVPLSGEFVACGVIILIELLYL